MRITRNDASVLELRGRQEEKEQGTSGLWLVFVVSLTFIAVSAFWLWDETSYGSASHRDFASKLSVFMASVLGIAGGLLLVFGIVLAVKRESLTIDFNTRTGIHRRWRLLGPETATIEFRLEQVAGVKVRERIESLSDGDGPTTHHQKWDALLHVQPSTFIPLCRSSNRVKVAKLADHVRRSLGMKLPEENSK